MTKPVGQDSIHIFNLEMFANKEFFALTCS